MGLSNSPVILGLILKWEKPARYEPYKNKKN